MERKASGKSGLFVKVLDFGIAKLTAETASLTKTDGALGTPQWLAPEQTAGDKITAAVDVWALGLIV